MTVLLAMKPPVKTERLPEDATLLPLLFICFISDLADLTLHGHALLRTGDASHYMQLKMIGRRGMH